MNTTSVMPLKMTDVDQENIALIMALYPNPTSKTAAIRLALSSYIRNADPVALAEARKTVSKARKAQGATK